jgi:hypothetical protein
LVAAGFLPIDANHFRLATQRHPLEARPFRANVFASYAANGRMSGEVLEVTGC